jgi:carboxymethylenebutenolidase
VRITLPSGTPAELARPAQASGLGVVLHPDIGGLRPLFDDLCARLAADDGWTVCAPEPFPGRETMTLEERMAAMAGLDDERQLGALHEAAAATECERVAVIGFCMGGMYTLKAAGNVDWRASGAPPAFQRAVAFYGMIRVPEQWRGPGHGEPLDALRAPEACPVLAIIGERDVWTPPDDVAALDALPNVTVVRYPEAEHGFVHDPDRPAHRAADAADAWRRAAQFLNEPLEPLAFYSTA